MKLPATIALVIISTTVFAQSRQITGRIVDEESQKGVPGATVTITDTQRNAVTNQLGYFSLNIEPTNKSLVVESLGYVTSKIDVPTVEAFKAAVKREYLRMEPLDLGKFSVEQLDSAESLEAVPEDQMEADAEYPGGWLYVYNDLARSLQNESYEHLLPDSIRPVRFTVLANGVVSDVRLTVATDSLKLVVEAAFKTLQPWRPARQNHLNTVQHFELPLVWTHEVEYHAIPVGGMNEFYRFVAEGVRYPAEARRKGLEGIVFVEFLIQKDGSITEVKAIKGVSTDLDKEAVRIISKAPKWRPATTRGKPVVDRFTFPIKFTLDGPNPRIVGVSFSQEPKSYAQWVGQNIKYPATARRMGVEGLVVVSFKVRPGGQVDSIRVAKDIGADCGKEAMRILDLVPEYMMVHLASGQQVYYQPFEFHLDPGQPADLSKWVVPGIKLLDPISITALGIERSVRYLAPGLRMTSSPGPAGVDLKSNTAASKRTYKSFQEALAKPRIEELSLVDKSITAIPVDIAKFKSLRFLDLENNQIRTLPAEIGTLTKLVKLFMPMNQLKELPLEISNLKSLRVLGLASNRFENFPLELLTLPKLTGLDLSGNKITTLPAAIGQMRDLQTLFLHDNNISILPEEFYRLTQLKALSLGGNPISEKDKERIEKTFRRTYIRFD
jgi:TonB family protein